MFSGMTDTATSDAESTRPPARKKRWPRVRGRHSTGKTIRLPTRANLDGRTPGARYYDATIDALTADLGGEEAISAIERRLIENFAGLAVLSEALFVKVMLGKQVDYIEACHLSSTLVRIGARLGLRRRPRMVDDVSLAQ
jgi:hypothetical protein